MTRERLMPPDTLGPGQGNASEGEDCADEISKDDGRNDDGEDHKGDWGSHSTADKVHHQGDD